MEEETIKREMSPTSPMTTSTSSFGDMKEAEEVKDKKEKQEEEDQKAEEAAWSLHRCVEKYLKYHHLPKLGLCSTQYGKFFLTQPATVQLAKQRPYVRIRVRDALDCNGDEPMVELTDLSTPRCALFDLSLVVPLPDKVYDGLLGSMDAGEEVLDWHPRRGTWYDAFNNMCFLKKGLRTSSSTTSLKDSHQATTKDFTPATGSPPLLRRRNVLSSSSTSPQKEAANRATLSSSQADREKSSTSTLTGSRRSKKPWCGFCVIA